MLQTPVAFVIFKRPDATAKVFELIRQARPSKLLVIADGPRADRPGEAEKCEMTRSIIEQVDWPCEVLKNYSEVNLGCKNRVSSGLDWVFENVEEAIILEDDCVPHISFFQFCQELLEHYRHDTRIMAIAGDNSRTIGQRTDFSYYFARSTPIWGWATWRRAWKHYDVHLKLWPAVRDGQWLQDMLGNPKLIKAWNGNFESVHNGTIDTWDYQWTFTCWAQNGLNIIANTNLISNCGFDGEATHTTDANDKLANKPVDAMQFPLKHPPFVIRDTLAELSHYQQDTPTLALRAQRKLRKMLKQLLP